MSTFRAAASALMAASILAGCATAQPRRYQELPAMQQMQPTGQGDRIAFRMPEAVRWGRYGSVMVEPVAVYVGQDHQFEDIAAQEKWELAEYMQQEFREVLGRRYQVVSVPRSDTLRVRLTLTGAKPNTAFVSTFTRFDLGGGPYNMVQSLRGKEGAFMGSVMYSVEVYDALTGQLLSAYVAKQFPNAMNVPATIGRLSAAKVGIDKGAEDLAAQTR